MMTEKSGFPIRWEMLTQKELQAIIEMFNSLDKGMDFSLLDIKRSWVALVLKWRGVSIKNTIDDMLLIDGIAKELDWLIYYENENKTANINYDCIECLLPRFHGLAGPENYGYDLTFGEYRKLLVIFNEISQGNNVGAYMDMLAGTLYRKYDKKLKRRVAFNPDYDYTRNAKRMPDWLKYYAYLWFGAFCQYLMTSPFIIDGNEINFSAIFTSPDSKNTVPENFIGMNSILFSVAESHVFGTVTDVDNTQLFRILMKLVDDKNRSDELKKSMKL